MKLRYFDLSEFACKHTGENRMNPDFLVRLDELRHRCGFPFQITSGYRDPSHPVEARKDKPGQHSLGVAADIAVANGSQRRSIVRHALDMGFGGIGVDQSFVHVDERKGPPTLWGY